MMKTLIKKLKQLDAAGDKATQGEWCLSQWGDGSNAEGCFNVTVPEYEVTPCIDVLAHDAEFIEHAANNRATIKAAIAALEKQARDIEVLRGALEDVLWFLEKKLDDPSRMNEIMVVKNAKQAIEQTGE